jgi:hypothetical protein
MGISKMTEKGKVETKGLSVYLDGAWQASGLVKLDKAIIKNGKTITHRIGSFGFTAEEAEAIVKDSEELVKEILKPTAGEIAREEYEKSRNAIENGMTMNGRSK